MIFEKVTEGVYRGSRPDPIKDIPRMKVATILNLEDDLVACLAEKLECNRLGIRYVQVSLDDFKCPSHNNLCAIADLIDALPKPLFVHCFHGHERTGIAIAKWRILRQGLTVKDAMKEMYAQGFSRWYFWWPKALRVSK